MPESSNVGYWGSAWLIGLPMIAATVVVHAAGLGLIAYGIGGTSKPDNWSGRALFRFSVLMGTTTLLLAVLHAAECALWAGAYMAVGAKLEWADAVFYSLSMVTTLGLKIGEDYAPHWRLLAVLEGMCGWLLFGLSTAFLFAVMERTWPDPARVRSKTIRRR